MANPIFLNNATTTIRGSLSTSATTIVVNDATPFPTSLTNGDWFLATLDGGGNYFEIVRVTQVVGTTWTVVRAQDNTTAKLWQPGSRIECRITAESLQQLSNSSILADLANTTDPAKGDALVGVKQPFAGAVARTQHDKNSDTIGVEDAGVTTESSNNTPAFNLVIAAERVGDISDAEYQISALINQASKAPRFVGRSRYKSKIKQTSNTLSFAIQSANASGVDLRDFTIDVTDTGASATSHPIVLLDVNDASVKGVNIEGITGTGSAILAYSADDLAGTINHIRFDDLKVVGNLADATNTNGPLITNGRYSMMRGIYSEQIKEYAVEYKNLTFWSLMSDVIINNSNNGIGFGQTTADASGVSYCAVSNFVTKDCAQGVIVGKGGYNAFSNGVVHIQTPFSAIKIGVRTSGGSVGNSFSNMLIAGDVSEAIRLGSLRNYVSGSLHNTATAVTLESGAQGNVVDVQHPGTRTSILSDITDSSGSPLSGSTANPIYCHATGEYRGILSTRWRWIWSSSGTTPQNSNHKWVYETAGNGSLNILSDGTGTNGFSVSMSGATRAVEYNWASNYWQFGTGTAFYRLAQTVFQCQTDNSASLGQASLRWSNTYSTNIRPGAGTAIWTSGAGSPEGVVTAVVGSMYTRTDGGAGTTLYVKETGAGNTGWVAK